MKNQMENEIEAGLYMSRDEGFPEMTAQPDIGLGVFLIFYCAVARIQRGLQSCKPI